jgi:hypothetical protein
VSIEKLDDGSFSNAARRLTLKTISIEKIFAFLVAFHSAFATFETLTSDPPEKTFAFVTIRRMSEGTELEVMRRSQRNWIDQRLKSLLIHMGSLETDKTHMRVCQRLRSLDLPGLHH